MSARRSGPVVFVAAAALPVLLWPRVIGDIASEFRFEPAYLLTGWTCWALMALGLLCLVPAAVADWRARRRRVFRRGTRAWDGWGLTLLLPWVALGTPVAARTDRACAGESPPPRN